MTLNIAIAQINTTLGGLAANAARIFENAQRAQAQGADLLLTPELALCGYPPDDLLLREDFYVACAEQLAQLAKQLSSLEIAVLIGHPLLRDGLRFNAASLFEKGICTATYCKRLFDAPTQRANLDEKRYFSSGASATVFTINNTRCALFLGEEWTDAQLLNPLNPINQPKADVILILSASSYHMGRHAERLAQLSAAATRTHLPVVYTNLVGGQDEQVFDGASCALNQNGELCCQLPAFNEALALVDFAQISPAPCATGTALDAEKFDAENLNAEIYAALVLALRDYVHKNAFPGVLLGLSGGIDSALVLAIAVDALGANQVRALMMPSPYTAQISLDDAREMATLLKVSYDEIAIEPAMQRFDQLLEKPFAGLNKSSTPAQLSSDTTAENLQARIRGLLLMAFSNKTGALLLTTGNKSETAVGYCTLYGDMAGGFALIKDIVKTRVYALAHWRNSLSCVIPERIINRAPSAELKPGQTDQDNLPPYAVLDAIIIGYMENNLSERQLIAQGIAEKDVRRVAHLLRISEHKRRQAPIGPRISPRAFGQDWRYPITHGYREFAQ